MQSDVYGRLESLEFSGIKLGLQTIQTLLDSLGNPQQQFSSILIAGTNGKGSVGAMLEQILVQHQVRTGYYISPHLVNVCERIRINGRNISSCDFEMAVGRVFHAIDRLIECGLLSNPPTYFETLTAAAFDHFSRSTVEWAVVEVGLGGRLDATNALNQNLSIITTIDLDHERYLGGTLKEIASEKAGVLKPDKPVVIGAVTQEAMDVILSVAQDLKCPVTQWDTSLVRGLHLVDGFPVFHYDGWRKKVRVGLRGLHQAQNAIVALQAVEQLKRMGIAIRRNQVRSALDSVRWPGRLDLISSDPLILVDCAHNEQGVRSLAAFLQDMKWNQVIALFTAMKDKSIAAMLEAVAEKIKVAVLTRVDPLHRCASMGMLSDACRDAGIRVIQREAIVPAYRNAVRLARVQHLPLVVFGSIYLAGSVLKLRNRNEQSLSHA